jgi:hypothetical protein
LETGRQREREKEREREVKTSRKSEGRLAPPRGPGEDAPPRRARRTEGKAHQCMSSCRLEGLALQRSAPCRGATTDAIFAFEHMHTTVWSDRETVEGH